MGVQYVPKKNSLKQQDRLPVETLEQAVGRITARRIAAGWSAQTYDEVIQIVADIFWITDKDLRKKVLVASKQIGGADGLL